VRTTPGAARQAPGQDREPPGQEGEGSDVLLDPSGVSFIDVIGLHVIEEAADAARHGGFGFAIAGPVPMAVRHVFVEAGAEHHLPRGQAVSFCGAPPPRCRQLEASCVSANARYVAMQMAIAIRRRSIGLAASVPYTSHPFWVSVPAVGGVGRLPATAP
jgi:hypothetical protein